MKFRLAAGFLLLGLAWMGTAHAAEAPAFPADPAQWLNAPPLSLEALKGKAVVLWYFEEGCPSCRARWPKLIEMSQKYADQPVVFIGVNSGNPRQAVERYAKEVRVPWPIIVDETRQFERNSGLTNEISLQNIWQVRYIDAQGNLQYGDHQNLEQTVEKALAGASWKVDPKEIPPALKTAWVAVETGDYASAAAPIKKALGDKKEEIKTAATKLNEFVQTAMAKDIEDATTKLGDDKWESYKALRSVADRYKGFEFPEDFKQRGSELHRDPEVKEQLELMKQLEGMKKSLMSNSVVVRKKAFDKLKAFVEEHPGTEAAKTGAEWIAQIEGAQTASP